MALTPQQTEALTMISDNPGRVLAMSRGIPGYRTVNGNTENGLVARGLIRVVSGEPDGPDVWEVTEAGLVALGRPVEIKAYVRVEGDSVTLLSSQDAIEEGRTAYRDALKDRTFVAHMGHAAKGSYQINYQDGRRVLLRPANREELPQAETRELPSLEELRVKLEEVKDLLAEEPLAVQAEQPQEAELSPAWDSGNPPVAQVLVEVLVPGDVEVEVVTEVTVHGPHDDPFAGEPGHDSRTARKAIRIRPGQSSADREFTTRLSLW